MKQAAGVFFLSLFFLVLLVPFFLTRCYREPRPEIPVRLYLTGKGKVITLDLEDYLVGVVAAEMPASFHPEALKAQAVAARTLTVKKMRIFGGSGCKAHPQADLSDDFRESQAWLSRQDLIKKWGFWEYLKNQARIEEAVKATAGLVLTYNGEIIEAVYHSTSGPRTENAEEIWGDYYPYLRSTECPFGQHSPRYQEEKFIPYPEFWAKLGDGFSPGAGPPALRILEYTAGGRVKTISVEGQPLRGETFRSRLGLNSSRFTFQMLKEGILFQTVGYGHGVGLCQYGADGMARQGWDFRSILKYYYRGVEIVRLKIYG